MAELGDRAAVELVRGDELVARLEQGVKDYELGGVARGGGERGAAALERRHPLFEDRRRRVGYARVNVAEDLEVEERGGVIDVIEDVRRGLKDRRSARAGGRIGGGAGVDRQGLEAVLVIAHRLDGSPPFARDDAGIDAEPGDLAREPAVLDLGAAVHDHGDPGRLGALGGGVVAHA